ncbi:hypothetical protein D9M71_788840 [compost metagenome]
MVTGNLRALCFSSVSSAAGANGSLPLAINALCTMAATAATCGEDIDVPPLPISTHSPASGVVSELEPTCQM